MQEDDLFNSNQAEMGENADNSNNLKYGTVLRELIAMLSPRSCWMKCKWDKASEQDENQTVPDQVRDGMELKIRCK